jgi:hypothetical protein
MAEAKKVFDVAPASKTSKSAAPAPQITSTHTTAPLSDTQTSEDSSTVKKIAVTVKPKEVTVQHEKLVAPLENSSQKEEPGTTVAEEPSEIPSNPTDDIESIETKSPEPSVASPTSAVDHAETSTSADLSSAPQPTELSTQVPKIFDSTEYQLPIQQRASHGTGMMMIKFVVVFLALLIIAAVFAIDAGWLDVGISLPFDVI